MEESRLSRSYADHVLRTIPAVRAYCDQHGVPYDTEFHHKAKPSLDVSADFESAYDIRPLPPRQLPERGTSSILVFERPINANHHGSVVAAVADHVGKRLQPAVETLHVLSTISQPVRQQCQPNIDKNVEALLNNQGVAVIVESTSWHDTQLDFPHESEKANAHWPITAFVVESTGNDGFYGASGKIERPWQKHDAISHSPPLIVHVGAAAKNANGQWSVEGYSSANSPTLLAPVAPHKKVAWSAHRETEPLTGSSVAAPYVGGVLAALNERYGPYLTREQILYAVFATCDEVGHVSADSSKTPHPKDLTYVVNKRGVRYNPEYAGFGLINPYKAEHLLGQMVHLAQSNQGKITVPVEERVRHSFSTRTPAERNKEGHYLYKIRMPDGLALKTTAEVQFMGQRGDLWLTSPSGTRLPMPTSGLNTGNEVFSISTSHGWVGEPLEGEWIIETTQPLQQAQLNQHHFQKDDLIASMEVPALLLTPVPDLCQAKTLLTLNEEHLGQWRTQRRALLSGMTVGGKEPDLSSFESMVAQLNGLPSAFGGTARISTSPCLIEQHTQGGQEEQQGLDALVIEEGVTHFLRAADLYCNEHDTPRQAKVLRLAGSRLLNLAQPYLSNTNPAKEAAELLGRAMGLYNDLGQLDLAYFTCCDLYRAQSRIWHQARTEGATQDAENALAAMSRLRHEARSLWERYNGGADTTAHRVEEGEMGFSAQERIGTDNTAQCLTLIARDPETRKTGLVHIDHQVEVNTLNQFFERFGNNRLHVRLVGAHVLNDTRCYETLGGISPNQRNIESVMRYLAGKNVNIISSDIGKGERGPSALVVDPTDFAVTERVPTCTTVNAAIGNAALLYTAQGKPLEVQFDFTEHKKRSPIFLSRKALQKIRAELEGKTEAELEQIFFASGYVDCPLVVDHVIGLVRAYQKEWSRLNALLVDAIGSQNGAISKATAAQAHDLLAQQRFFVGENAEDKNVILYHWIKNTLFMNGAVSHVAKQGALRFDHAPHRMVTPKATIGGAGRA